MSDDQPGEAAARRDPELRRLVEKERLVWALEFARSALMQIKDATGAITGSATYAVRGCPGMVNVRMGRQEFNHLREVGVDAAAAIDGITTVFKEITPPSGSPPPGPPVPPLPPARRVA